MLKGISVSYAIGDEKKVQKWSKAFREERERQKFELAPGLSNARHSYRGLGFRRLGHVERTTLEIEG
jgi:hypothetical protein